MRWIAVSLEQVDRRWPGILDRAISWGVGIGLLLGTARGFWLGLQDEQGWLARIVLAMVHLFAAWLFIRRARARSSGGARGVMSALPSMVFAGAVFELTPPSWSWSLSSTALVLLGLAIALVGLSNLSRSFSIFPARRAIKTGGLYRWVRHPVYAGELVMVLGLALASGGALGLVLFALTLASMIPRMLAEERLLSHDPAYCAYRQRCRWRLLPGLW